MPKWVAASVQDEFEVIADFARALTKTLLSMTPMFLDLLVCNFGGAQILVAQTLGTETVLCMKIGSIGLCCRCCPGCALPARFYIVYEPVLRNRGSRHQGAGTSEAVLIAARMPSPRPRKAYREYVGEVVTRG